MLSPRQELLLGKVVDLFAEAGQPVGSKALAAEEEIGYGSSTIRNELAVSATVKDVADGVATVEAEAVQDGRRIIRKGKAELRVG